MTEETVVIEGEVLIDPPASLDGAVAIVRLRDTALADAPARDVASTRVPLSGAAIARIRFRLSARVDPMREYSLAAEVRRDGGNRLRPGDLLTTEHHVWHFADTGHVQLRTRTIS
jgi:uncharacterized lipoprotein YbaY